MISDDADGSEFRAKPLEDDLASTVRRCLIARIEGRTSSAATVSRPAWKPRPAQKPAMAQHGDAAHSRSFLNLVEQRSSCFWLRNSG